MINYMPAGMPPQDYAKYNERRMLRKTSNGLGMFVLVYFLTMLFCSIGIQLLLSDMSNSSQNGVLNYFCDIFVSVTSAFIPGLIYLALTKRKVKEIIFTNHVKFGTLIPLIFIGIAFSMLANTVSDLMNTNLEMFGLKNTVNFSNEVNSVPEVLLYAVSTAVVPAFAEEFAFRGILMGSLRKYGDVFAIIVSSVMFGAMHGNVVQIPFAFMLGLIFGFVDCKTNSLFPSIGIHFLNNFYAVLMDILQNNTNMDKGTFLGINYFICVLFCVLGLLSFLYIVKTQKGFFKATNDDIAPYQYTNYLNLKEKIKTFMFSPAIVVLLVLFISEAIRNLIPLSNT